MPVYSAKLDVYTSLPLANDQCRHRRQNQLFHALLASRRVDDARMSINRGSRAAWLPRRPICPTWACQFSFTHATHLTITASMSHCVVAMGGLIIIAHIHGAIRARRQRSPVVSRQFTGSPRVYAVLMTAAVWQQRRPVTHGAGQGEG